MKSNFGKNNKWKRVVAGALAALMLVTSSGTDYGVFRSYAAEETPDDISPASELPVKLDSYSIGFKENDISITNVPYGTLVGNSSFEIANNNGYVQSVTQYIYVSKADVDRADGGDISWYTFDEDKKLEPGEYYIGFVYKYLEETGLYDDEQVDYLNIMTVVPANISSATELSWDDDNNASFVVPSKTQDGNDIDVDDIEGYELKLYKFDEVIEGEEGKKTIPASDITDGKIVSDAFVSQINAYGDWTFSVKAVLADGAKSKYTEPVELKMDDEKKKCVPDGTEPIVADFEVAGEADDGFLSANFKDDESGVNAYCFSNKSKNELNDDDWIALETAVVGGSGVTKTMQPSVAGTYRAYAKDASGNVAVSSDTQQVTVIHFAGEGNVNTKIHSKVFYGTGTNELSLSGIEPTRIGYTFKGWYQYENLEGEQLESIPANDGSDHYVYAKWEADSIAFKNDLSPSNNINRDYNGNSSSLTVAVDYDGENYSSVSYEWYRYPVNGDTYDTNPVKVENLENVGGKNGDTLTVKNVDDSGKYFAKAIVTTKEDDCIYAESGCVEIKINPLTLSITTKDQTITVGDTPTDYEYSVKTFLTGETREVLEGYVSCEYNPSSSIAGEYEIKGNNIIAKHGNYDINYTNGKLVVKPHSVKADDIIISLSREEYSYNGDPKGFRPDVTVSVLGRELSPEDYVVEYRNNIQTGIADVVITMTRNFEGSNTAHFTITKAEIGKPILSINDKTNWTYGDEFSKHAFSCSNNESGGTITYYYRVKSEKDEEVWTAMTDTNRPTDAGDYEAYLVIAGTDNYKEISSDVVPFSIKQREITFTAGSTEWEYQDGTNHTYDRVNRSGDLVKPDELQYVTTEIFDEKDNKLNYITNAGTYTNKVKYEFTPSTNANNYKVTCIDGQLTINSRRLVSPSNVKWDEHVAGRASWTAIIRNNLEITYNTVLYRYDEDSAEWKEVKDRDKSSSTPYVDYGNDIREIDAKLGSGKYYFTVQAIPSGGTSQGNYYAGDKVSTKGKSEIRTITVNVTGDEKAISSLGIGTNNLHSYVAIENEILELNATKLTGYIWDATDGTPWSITSNNKEVGTLNSLSSSALKENSISQKFTVSSADRWQDTKEINLHVSVTDEAPVIKSFDAKYVEGSISKVNITLKASDSKKIVGYYVSNNNENITKTSDVWKTDAISEDGKNIEKEIDVDATTIPVGGSVTYYAWVIDDDGNIARCDDIIEPISLYRVDINKGEDSAVKADEKSAESFIKIKDKVLILPKLPYTYTGYSFLYWQDRDNSSSRYDDEGHLSDNKSETLIAKWTLNDCTYTIKYYREAENGKYPDTPFATNTKTGKHGDVVKSSDDSFARTIEGYVRDEERDENLTLSSQNENILNIYYKRVENTITYQYWTVDASGAMVGEKQTLGIDEYKYNTVISDKAKPEDITGYKFVGWLYDGSTTKPERMPNKSIVATGYYSPVATSYVVNFFEENLKEAGTEKTTYSIKSSETRYALHNEVEEYGVADAPEKIGFTAIAVTTSIGAPSAELPASPSTQVSEKASSVEGQTLNINVFYKRNRHDVKLKVYIGDRNGGKMLTEELVAKELAYGTSITDDDKANWPNKNIDSWNNAEKWADKFPSYSFDSYKLADYADWSAGKVEELNMMPDGDIVISREYVSTIMSRYNINIYYQDVNPDKYNKKITLTMYDNIGTRVEIGNSKASGIEGNSRYINYNDFGSYLPEDFKYYVYSKGCGSQVVNDTTDEQPIEFNIYFNRITKDVTINYYIDGVLDTSKKVVLEDVRWGTQIDINPFKYFEDYKNDYVVSYDSYTIYYKYDESKKNYELKEEWPGKVYTLPTQLADDAKYTVPCDRDREVNVRYNKVETNNTYQYDLYYNSTNLNSGCIDAADAPLVRGTKVPLTVTVEGNVYQVAIANETDILDGAGKTLRTDITEEQWAKYPASKNLKENYTISEGSGDGKSPKTNVKVVSYNGHDYYTKTINGTNYIYVLDTNNRLYKGNRFSISISSNKFNGNGLGWKEFEDYLTKYRTNHSPYAGEVSKPDNAVNAYYCHDGSVSGLQYDIVEGGIDNVKNHISYTIRYEKHIDKNVYYVIGSTPIPFSYPHGATVVPGKVEKSSTDSTIVDVEDSEGFPSTSKIAGSRVVWYEDEAYTKPIVATPFILEGDVRYYGRYEKILYEGSTEDSDTNIEYAHFQLANEIVLGGEKVSFIDQSNLEAAKDYYGPHWTEEDVTDTIVLIDEFNRTHIKNVTVKEYKVDGEIVLIKRPRPAYSFSTITIGSAQISEAYNENQFVGGVNGDDYTPGYYKIDGNMFYYDDTRSENRSYAYCETNPVRLHAYYSRYKYNLTLDKQDNVKINNTESFVKVNGEHIVLETPTKDGYLFTGWKISKESEDAVTDLTAEELELIKYKETTGSVRVGDDDVAVVTGASFVMPKNDLRVTGKWVPGDAGTHTFTYYYQKIDETYDTAHFKAMKEADDDNKSESNGVTTYLNGGQTIGLSKTLTIDGETVVAYYAAISGTVAVEPKYLIAVERTCNGFVSDRQYSVKDNVISGIVQNVANYKDIEVDIEIGEPVFTYASTSYHYDHEALDLNADSSFVAKSGMVIESFYTRKSDCVLHIENVASDMEEENGLVTTGDGTYMYGATANIKLVVDDAYEFVGLFKKSDIYDESGIKATYADEAAPTKFDVDRIKAAISNSSLKSMVTGENGTYTATYDVRKTEELIALTTPKPIADTTATASANVHADGDGRFIYGYKVTSKNTIKVQVELTGSDDAKDNTVISGYQWYEKKEGTFVAIEGATNATYIFPEGKNVGEYAYVCDVTLTRADNKRTSVSRSGEVIIIVESNDYMPIVSNYYGPYDGKFHNIEVEMPSYVEAGTYEIYYALVELNSSNYEREGKKEKDFEEECKTGIAHRELVDVKDADASAYEVYYYIHSTDGQFRDYACPSDKPGKVFITPITANVIASATGSYTKYYDGTNELTDEHKASLRKGSYYTMSNILEGEQEKYHLALDFTGVYNSENVDDATYVSLSELKVVYTDGDGKIVSDGNNYNYVFKITQFNVAAKIDPKKVGLNWAYSDNSELSSEGNGTENNPFIYEYTGSDIKPYATLVESDILEKDRAILDVEVTGAKRNVGANYIANAVVATKEGVTGDNLDKIVKNYEFPSPSAYFSITRKAITVGITKDQKITYDGKKHFFVAGTTLTGADPKSEEVTKYFTFPKLADDQTIYAKSNEFGEEVGKYTFTIDKANIRIFSNGVNVTNNYEISIEETPGEAEIVPRTLTISGFEAINKVYDGNNSADINYDNVKLQGVVTEDIDSVAFNKDGHVTATFEDKNVGDDKAVTVVLNNDDQYILAGDKAHNYTLDISEDGYSTNANITIATLTISPESIGVVYGEQPEWKCKLTGLADDDNPDRNITANDVVADLNDAYKIKQSSEVPVLGEDGNPTGANETQIEYVDFWKAAPDYRPVGTYIIHLNEVQLKEEYAKNYKLVISNDDDNKVTVNKRQINIVSQSAEQKKKTSKIYDASTDCELVKETNYSYDGLATGHGASDVSVDKIEAHYENASVGVDKKIDLTRAKYTITGSKKDNYEIGNTAALYGNITLKEVSVTATAEAIVYGTANSDIVYSISTEPELNITDTNKIKEALEFSTNYDSALSERRNVGSYSVTPQFKEDVSFKNLEGKKIEFNNFIVTLNDGTLTVDKADIYVIAKSPDPIMYQGTDAIPTNYVKFMSSDAEDAPPAAVKYETETELSGLFDSGREVNTDKVTYSYGAGVNYEGNADKARAEIAVDIYPINPNVGLLNTTYTNYNFIPKPGYLEVVQRSIRITGIEFVAKEYDGTENVLANQINLDNVTFEYVDNSSISSTTVPVGEDSDSTITKDSIEIKEAKYVTTESVVGKDVGENKEISFEIVAKTGTYLAKNYAIQRGDDSAIASQTTAIANITQRPIYVSADNIEIKYGSSRPAFTYTVPNNVIEADVETVEEAINTGLQYACDYDAGDLTNSLVGDYVIKMSSTGSTLNYNINYPDSLAGEHKAGKLTVKPNQFKMSEIVWSSDLPGTVSFNKVDDIGKTGVAKYILQLYQYDTDASEYNVVPSKTGVVPNVEITADGADTYTYSFAESIRNNGPGQYIVRAKAVSGNSTNVVDSKDNETSNPIYAAKIIASYKVDADTNKGKLIYTGDFNPAATGTIGQITINNEAKTEFVVLTGEQIDSSAEYRTQYGYTASAKANSLVITANGTPSYDSSKNVSTFEVNLDATRLKTSDDIQLVYTLVATKASILATLDYDISVPDAIRTKGVEFGQYGENDLKFQMSLSAAEGDLVGSDGYVYSYRWSYRKGLASEKVFLDAEYKQSNSIKCLPKNLEVYSNWSAICDVQAVRKDNGEKATINRSKGNIKVTPGNLGISSLTIEGWKYGEARKVPSISTKPDVTSEGASYKAPVRYEYSTINDVNATTGWSQVVPTDAGTYYLKATVNDVPADKSNYSKATSTEATKFVIEKAKLENPANVSIENPSEKAPYGLIKWDEVTGPVENAGIAGSKGAVGVEYKVILYKVNSVCDSLEAVKTSAGSNKWEYSTAETSIDVSSDITLSGIYYATVQAISKDSKNCDDSSEVLTDKLDISGYIVATDEANDTVLGKSNEVVEVNKQYDNKNIVLTMNGIGDEYAWYKSGSGESIGSGATYVVKNCDESSIYTCKAIKDGVVVYSVYMGVNITERPITIVTGNLSKTYDGNALTKDLWWIAENENAVDAQGNATINAATSASTVTDTLTGNIISGISVTGTITNISDDATTVVNNTLSIEGISIKDSENKDVKGNYDIQTSMGQLTLNQRTIATSDIADDVFAEYITVSDLSANDYIYNKKEHKPTVEVKDVTRNAVIGTSSSEPGYVVIEYLNNINASTGDNKAKVKITGHGNYTGTVYRTFIIKKKPVSLTWYQTNRSTAYTSAYTYNGAEQSVWAKVNNAEDGDTVNIDDAAYSNNKFTSVGQYKALVSEDDTKLSNDNYTLIGGINLYKNWEISKQQLRVTATSPNVVYDGQAHKISLDIKDNGTGTNPHTTYVVYYSENAITDSTELTEAMKVCPEYKYVRGEDTASGESVYTVYYCVVADNYDKKFGTATVTIKQREINVKIADKSKTYDGTPLISDDYSLELKSSGVSGNALASGDIISSIGFDGTVTNVTPLEGEKALNELVTGTTIKNDNDDVTSSYKINSTSGNLTIKARSIAVAGDNLVVSGPAAVDYNGSEHTPTDIVISDNGLARADKKLGVLTEYKISGYENNINCSYSDNGEVKDQPCVVIVGVGNFTGTYKVPFTINKVDQVLTSEDVNVNYDGASHGVSATVAPDATVTGDDKNTNTANSVSDTGVGKITYSSETNNARINAGTETVTITAAETRNYKSAQITKTITILPVDLSKVVVSATPVIFTGSNVGPTDIKVYSDIPAVDTLLTNIDYDIVANEDDSIRSTAVYPGTYTLKVTGKHNYQGSVTTTYSIVDNATPVISGGTSDKPVNLVDHSKNIYCVTAPTLKVEDPTLKTVEIKSGDTLVKSYTLTPETAEKINGKVVQNIPATDMPGTVEGKKYTIIATDMSNNSSNVEVTVYSNHAFTRSEYVESSDKLTHSAPCNHECGYIDTKAIKYVTVKWEYYYDYNSIDGQHTGIQGNAERATGAKVELLQDGVVVATTYLDCDDECGASGSQTSATKSCTFTKIDSAAEDDPSGLLPIKKADGTNYEYAIRVTATNNGTDHNNAPEGEYEVRYTLDQLLTEMEGSPKGTFAEIQYEPDTFFLPWIVTVDSPNINGNIVEPDKIYVKVLYALGGNETVDSEYKIISQQVSDDGVACDIAEHVDGKTIFEGQYPVWKGVGSTGETYYYRIQVVGYDYEGIHYDVTANNFRSICDDDHVNHTTYYAGHNSSSGIIRYELTGLLQKLLLLDYCQGADTTNMPVFEAPKAKQDVFLADSTGTVAFTNIENATPSRRENYDFLGWFDAQTGGNEVTEDVTGITSAVRIYAHWKENVAPSASVVVGDNTFTGAFAKEDIVPEEGKVINGELIKPQTIVATGITVKASDDGANTGVNNSGMDRIYYYLATGVVENPASDLTDTEWIEAAVSAKGEDISYTIPAPANGYYIVYVKAVDKDGNVAYANTQGFVFEKYIAPTVTPTATPIVTPTVMPTTIPTVAPTATPMVAPTTIPTVTPVDDQDTMSNTPEDVVEREVVKVTPIVAVVPEKATTSNRVNRPKATPVVTPETPQSSPEDVVEKEVGKGIVEVTVEHNVTEGSMSDDNADSDKPAIKVSLPDTDSVIDAVLNDDEKKIIDKGGNIVIRLTVDNKDNIPTDDLNNFMNDLLNDIRTRESLNDMATVQYVGSLEFTLEKQIDGTEWEKISEIGKPIEVVIDIPAELVGSGKRIYIAKPDGNGGYILFEDLDDSSDTITISTDDFENEYIIISIEDNDVALADKTEDDNCYWHWFQILLFIIAIATAITYWKKEDENAVPDMYDSKDRMTRRKGHWIIVVAANGCSMLLIFLGGCVYEIPLAIATVVISSLVEAIKGYKNK